MNPEPSRTGAGGRTPPASSPAAPLAGGGPLAGAAHTLFGGYGPFVALVALILAMALLAPTIAPERVVTTRQPASPAAGSQPSSAPSGCCR